jgi:hypothetical protein
MMADRCTCPPIADVFRSHVHIGTREPCPIHPDPDLTSIKLVPLSTAPLNISRVPLPHRRARRS